MENTCPTTTSTAVRRAMRIRGTVQGVGFRPAIHRIARSLSLGGFVRNDAEGIWLEIEGRPDAVESFARRLRLEAPTQARIDSMDSWARPASGESDFHILSSRNEGDSRAGIPSDAAPCDACLREMLDPRNRRYGYPFINCTDCGPRYTIVRELPYDRSCTTMQTFALCDECRREYEDPCDRRFHAEPNACPRCGPRLELVGGDGARIAGPPALWAATERIAAGQIVAVKGVGGFLLAVDATNGDAVARLRFRKNRPDKPLAIMARDLGVAEQIAHLDPKSRRELQSRARPIVLLPKRSDSRLASGIVPHLATVGVFLPPTPLQHLLVINGPALQVMTSGNRADEPLAADEAEAHRRLTGIADAYLQHDRPVHTRVDDSVVRIVSGESRFVRRARGYVPEPIQLGFSAPPVLAVGAELKSTICVTRGGEAYVSQHIGDLSSVESFGFFEETIRKLPALLGVQPEVVAHDLHPDYRSSRWANRAGLPRETVQHHHAHIASVLAEHRHTGPVIGVAFDGTGYGADGTLWGGEILSADLLQSTRLGHLRPLALPGGEAAIREPWRLAVTALLAAGESTELIEGIERSRLKAIQVLVERHIASPQTTSAGRWFDAAAALCGIGHCVSYEAQAAIEFEATCTVADGAYSVPLLETRPLVIDPVPAMRELIADLGRGTPVGVIACRFIEGLARGVTQACLTVRRETHLRTVALSGGCFQNRRLTERLKAHLEREGFTVLLNRLVPCNDGGLSLGQAAVAAFRRARAKEPSACV